MLSVSSYSQAHVDRSRARVAVDVAAYADLARAAGGHADAQLGAFEPIYFNALLLALDRFFLHRARGQEGKDGNPLNEVRVLCNSLTDNDGVVVVEKAIRLKPEASVLGHAPGDRIELDQAGFERLAAAFLAEIEAKYR